MKQQTNDYLRHIVRIDKIFQIDKEIEKALSVIIDNYRKEGCGFGEIMLGLAQGFKDILLLFCESEQPRLNREAVTELVKIWMSSYDDDEYKKVIDDAVNEQIAENIKKLHTIIKE